jgi:hypothetical protein
VRASDHCANSGTDEEVSMMEMAYISPVLPGVVLHL